MIVVNFFRFILNFKKLFLRFSKYEISPGKLLVYGEYRNFMIPISQVDTDGKNGGDGTVQENVEEGHNKESHDKESHDKESHDKEM